MIKDAFRQIPGAKFFTNEDRHGTDGGHVLQDRHKINNGIPSLDEMELLEFVPNGGHVCFSPVSAPDGPEALRQSEMVRGQPTNTTRTTRPSSSSGCARCTTSACSSTTPQDAEARQETLDLTRLLVKEAAEEGYGEYRTHNALMDDVMAHLQLGRRGPAEVPREDQGRPRPQRDPRAGKSGIWPKRYRGQKL